MSQTTRKFSQVTLQWDCYSNKQRVSIVYVCSGHHGRSGSLMVCVEWCWKVCSSFYFYMQFLALWSIKLTRLWPHITITRPSLHHQNSSCEDNTSTSEVSDWPVATGSDFLKIFLDKFWVPLDITFKIFPSLSSKSTFGPSFFYSKVSLGFELLSFNKRFISSH